MHAYIYTLAGESACEGRELVHARDVEWSRITGELGDVVAIDVVGQAAAQVAKGEVAGRPAPVAEKWQKIPLHSHARKAGDVKVTTEARGSSGDNMQRGKKCRSGQAQAGGETSEALLSCDDILARRGSLVLV